LYHGNLRGLVSEVPIDPTMVFVDGDHRYEGVKDDTNVLSNLLRPNIPVLFHDFLNEENDTGAYGVRRAACEWEEAGFVAFKGAFGCSGLFLTTDKCRGRNPSLSSQGFRKHRDRLLKPVDTHTRAGKLPQRFSRRVAETIAWSGPSGRRCVEAMVYIKHRLLG
ncbi:MAG: class I SAM-dependent methyltransferase, partial [Terriglobales bacterium]